MTTVDTYLDELFDRLAGSGPDGRRLLAEAEQHLADAVAEARSRGLGPEEAEREAVDRFGAVSDIVPTPYSLRVSLRRLAAGLAVLTGAGLSWYGLSGVLTWLIAGPWVRLLIRTDSFGTNQMCGPAQVGGDFDCYAYWRGALTAVPWGGHDFPFVPVALAGVLLLAALAILRRRTGPAWTPPATTIGLALAVPSGIAGLLLLFYGVMGVLSGTMEFGPSYGVAGLTAVILCEWTVRRLRRSSGQRRVGRRG